MKILYFLILVTLFFNLSCSSKSKIIKLIRREKSPRESPLKKSQPLVRKGLVKREVGSNTGSLRLINDFNTFYYGEIGFGTPKQMFSVVFDTSGFDSWIGSTKCEEVLGILCTSTTLYDNTASSTYEAKGDEYEVDNGDGTLTTGFLSQDKVTIANIEVNKQVFMEATDFDFSANYLGVFGLGFNENTPNLIDNMFEQSKIDKKVFSFYINRNDSSSIGGELFLGGNNPNYYTGNLTYTDLTDAGYWQIELKSIISNEKTFCNEACDAIISTSIPYIYGPQAEINELNYLLGFADDGTIDCNQIGNLSHVDFIIDDKVFSLSPDDYLIKDTECYSGFNGDTDYWILGQIFMGAYYTEFDAENYRVGFALTIGSKSKIKNYIPTTTPSTGDDPTTTPTVTNIISTTSITSITTKLDSYSTTASTVTSRITDAFSYTSTTNPSTSETKFSISTSTSTNRITDPATSRNLITTTAGKLNYSTTNLITTTLTSTTTRETNSFTTGNLISSSCRIEPMTIISLVLVFVILIP